jgi:bacterial/archaeal transporter family protein
MDGQHRQQHRELKAAHSLAGTMRRSLRRKSVVAGVVPMSSDRSPAFAPVWLLWSLLTIAVWGAWGFLSKVASAEVDMYLNQVLYTVGLVPLMVFFVWTVRRETPPGPRERRQGAMWAFLTGILGGLGNIAFFEALIKGGKASVVAPATALFPMVTVVLALVFLKERLNRSQMAGLLLAFVSIYLLSA